MTETIEPALRLNEQHQQASSYSCNTKMFLPLEASKRRHSPADTRCKPSPSTSSQLLVASLLFLLNVATVLCQFDNPMSSGPLDQPQMAENQHLSTQSELLVQPNSARRIECKLPSLAFEKGKRMAHWNVVRSASNNKGRILCYRDECQDAADNGIQLANEPPTGTYDLNIPKVTYDLHDGLYTCYYRDSELNQTINREYRLTVLIPPRAPTIAPAMNLSPLAREGQEYQLNCTSQGGNPEPTFGWFRNGELIEPGFIKIERANNGAGSHSSLLKFQPSVEDHQATYKCKVWNKAMGELAAHERDFQLQVEYSPKISVGLYNPLRVLQGSPVTLSCSVDANPPVKGIQWYKEYRVGTGQPISNQFNHTIIEARSGDAGEYTCLADNGIAAPGQVSSNGQHSEFGRTAVDEKVLLQVLYGPRVSVRPYPQIAASGRDYERNSRVMNEGESFILNCSADASPPAQEYIWTKADDPSFKRLSLADNTTLEFNSLSASDSGNYTCTAFNKLNPSALSSSSSTVGQQQQQQLLERQGSGSFVLQVRHKPGEASIELGANGEAVLGTKTQLVCRAKPPGYPEPSYKFYKMSGSGQKNKLLLSKQQNHGAVYTIHSAKPEDEARYGCEASNDLGSSTEAFGELIVNEPPHIIKDTTTLKDNDARLQGDRPYTITVRASGKPMPKVSWFHRSPVDGRTIELSSSISSGSVAEHLQSRYEITTNSQSEHHSSNQNRPRYSVTSTLTFKQPLEVNDRGLYSVEFDNGLSRPDVHRIQLHIHHAPIPAPKNQPILAASPLFGRASQQQQPLSSSSDTRIKAGFDPGDTVNLTCRVSAYPKPEFVWHDKTSTESDSPITANNRYRTTISNPEDDIWESSLTFDALHESDYGDYLCVTANHDQQTNRLSDSIRIIVSLKGKTPPDTPSQLEALEASQDSITLQWIPGFDGGGTNLQYQVQYAPDDGSGQSLSKRYPNSASLELMPLSASSVDVNSLDAYGDQQQPNSAASENGGYPRLQVCQSPSSCTIEQLAPRQAYLFRVRTRSNIGASDFSDQLRASTRANLSQIPKILDASYDTSQNILYFKVEPNSDYLLNNLNARIEARSNEQLPPVVAQSDEHQSPGSSSSSSSSSGEWRLHSLVPLRNERAQAHLNMQPEAEQLRITLCSKSNELICGPEFVISLRSAASSFLQAERGFSVTLLALALLMIAVLCLIATSIHSCCLSRRKNKKAEAIERSHGAMENKCSSNDGQVTANGGHHVQSQTSNGSAIIKGSHGSTTSTNSTSATNGVNGLQSMDSIVNGVALTGGSSSDHSSDHSRQAKLDSMMPPNYNHYADRASILMEQQQQQMQMQMQMQQQGLMATHDKLSSPFGLANNALLGVASHQLASPMMNGSNYFTYGQAPMELQQQQQDDTNQMLGLESDGKQQQMWPSSQMDEYSNYNPLAYSTLQNQQQSQEQQQMIDPTYGTATSLMMSQQSAAYDNSSNQFQQQSAYLSSPAGFQQQQQQQYQQELANAQQQMYGTLTRNSGYSATGANNNATSGDTSSLAHDQTLLGSSAQQQLYEQQYGTTNGLMQPPSSQPQESDYGTTGARRPIREIIV